MTKQISASEIEKCRIALQQPRTPAYGDMMTYAKKLEEELNHVEANLKLAWEAGFTLCSSYGDNKRHFHGEQKEKQWQKFLESIKHD